METSLHRQLKEIYADDNSQIEVRCGRYRIDVMTSDRLIEVQHGSLAAIQSKISHLLREHEVLVVKPIVVRKRLIKLDSRDGKVLTRRMSPKTGHDFDLFDELVYFTRVFPHENLHLEVPLVDVEEWRFPGHGRRRRRRERDHQVQDQKLLAVHQTHQFSTAGDLWKLIPNDLPVRFNTGDLATSIGTQRWIAQRIAYCLRKMGAAKTVGKQGNALLYERCA